MAVRGQELQQSAVIRCRSTSQRPEADPLTCGFSVGVAAGALCEDVSLAPKRLRSAFQQGLSVRLADSSVLVAEVELDTLNDDLVIASDPCTKPLQQISRDWRFLGQEQASAVFSSVLDGLRRARKGKNETCILDSRPSPARRATVYVIFDDLSIRRVVVLSIDEQTVPSQNSFVQVSVVARDSAKSEITLTGQQRTAPCRDALRVTNAFQSKLKRPVLSRDSAG